MRFARIRALAAERPDGDAAALFELAAAHDSTGEPDLAEPLYRRALEARADPAGQHAAQPRPARAGRGAA